MNIFILDKDPILAASFQCDKHVVKMTLESCQLLSNAHVIHGKNILNHPLIGMGESHQKHPCSIWACANSSNYLWLSLHAKQLCKEYTLRYGKKHKLENLITQLGTLPKHIPIQHISNNDMNFVLCMPDNYKICDPVSAYRAYYIGEKSRFAKWKLGNVPNWFPSLSFTI